jgi:A/G-specific adenine glycosylase
LVLLNNPSGKIVVSEQSTKLQSFCDFIWNFYALNKRDFPWRNVEDPYKVFVSEIMLQQTQTFRVIEKYHEFIETFPTFQDLAHASLRDVLTAWQGLGYNRRGKFLHQSAQRIVTDHDGKLPNDPLVLVELPGIGPATAASMVAFAYNMPTVFIETNIRAVFIHSFFPEQEKVHDRDIMPLVAATVDQENAREWYYALMDYGVYLKKRYPNPSRKSVHHNKQSTFQGSDRQIRGMIIRMLTTQYPALERDQLIKNIHCEPARVARILDELIAEKMISSQENIVCIN